MGMILALISFLAGQLLLGGLIVACTGFAITRGGKQLGLGRRRRLAWFEAGRSLGGPVALALIVFAASALPVLLIADLRPGLPPVGLIEALILVTGLIAVAGCTLLIRSGELDYRGYRSSARRLGRLGGKTLFAATIGLDAMLFSFWLGAAGALRETPEATFSLAFGVIALALAGFIGLLVGLSGKSRPSGGFAVALHLAGQTAAVAGLVLATVPTT